MIDEFNRRYEKHIEALSHFTRGYVDRRRIAKELKRYVREYGIDIGEACEALARKWSHFNDIDKNAEEHVLYQSPGLGSIEPSPKFALDALEGDIFTSLLTRARHKTVAKYMSELGYDEKTVEKHMPLFIRKWKEIRDIEWANLLIMKPLGTEENY